MQSNSALKPGVHDPMRNVIRQAHRWISIIFTLTVIANFIGLAIGKGQQPPAVVTYSPLPPLALLLFSGLYMFALPYMGKAKRETAFKAES
jgi:hypothetical protein